MTQPALLPRIAEGDTHATRAFIQRYRPLVASLARRSIANHADAEDAVQEVFVELWRCAARYRAERGSEASFVAAVARRRLIDRLRRRARSPQLKSIDGEIPAGRECEPEARSEAARAMAAASALRPARRNAVLLSACVGMSHREIAHSTRMPLGTVKAHVRRGLAELRAQLSAVRPAMAVG